VRYMLLIYLNPEIWESLSEEDRNQVFRGHDAFIKMITESGEMVGTEALADPSNSATVRVRDGVPAVTEGTYVAAGSSSAATTWWIVTAGSGRSSWPRWSPTPGTPRWRYGRS
jgi:hypothetical protein